MHHLKIESVEQIDSAAAQILSILKTMPSKCVTFYGKMGAGKTTLIKSICKTMGVADNVSSPTFAIINEYRTTGNTKIYHFDFYRINKIEEVFDFGYEEYFYSNEYCFIEWPEKIAELLPENHIRISITETTNGCREIEIEE